MADDFASLAAEFAAKAAKLESQMGAVVRKSAADVERNAKAIVPVDTGNLRASIGVTMVGPHQAEIGSTADYAAYVEFGTSRMGPAAFIGPSLDRYSANFVEAIGKLGDL